jgi:hypothetical protein
MATFTCCTLATVNVLPTAVTSGTQYWVVASTPTTGTGDDFLGVWNYVPPAKPTGEGISQSGSPWGTIPAFINEPAGAVYGTP